MRADHPRGLAPAPMQPKAMGAGYLVWGGNHQDIHQSSVHIVQVRAISRVPFTVGAD